MENTSSGTLEIIIAVWCEFPLQKYIILISKVMRSFHPFKNSHEGYDALSPVEVQVSVYLFNLHNCSFRDSLITSSNCCFLNSTLGIFSSVPFLRISGISAIYLKLQDHVHLLFLVPFSSTSLMHYWVLLRDMIPVLKSLWHFYCAHLILHTLQ